MTVIDHSETNKPQPEIEQSNSSASEILFSKLNDRYTDVSGPARLMIDEPQTYVLDDGGEIPSKKIADFIEQCILTAGRQSE